MIINSSWSPRRQLLLLLVLLSVPIVSYCDRLPFTFLVGRSWVLGDEEKVGTRVATLRPMSPHPGVTYAIQKGPNGDDVDLSTFFNVDKHGNVILKKELKAVSGVSSSLYLGAEGDDIISFKTEIHVKVVPQDQQHLHNNHQQFFQPPRPTYFSTTPTATVTTTSNATNPPPTPTTTAAPPAATSTTKTSSSPLPPVTTTSLSPPPPSSSTSSDSLWVWLLSLFLLFLLVSLTVFVIHRRLTRATTTTPVVKKASSSTSVLGHWSGKRAHSNRYDTDPSSSSPGPPAAPTSAAAAPQLPPFDKWELPRSSLKIVGMLGEGCFGQVWRYEQTTSSAATSETETTVAVKTLKETAGDRERADLLSELSVMKALDPHPNVVRLIGCCTESDPIFVVMEFVALGKLQSYLRESRDYHYYGNLHSDSNSLSSTNLTKFAHQCARGMQFLASKGIIHRDLAARNILVSADLTCKVSDFGFARDLLDNHVYERKSDGRLPIRWMAPEALFDNLFTTKTDVWSFGVLMWEIVTLGSMPYPGMGASEVMKKVRDGYRLEKPSHCRRELYNIMFYCWAASPDDRPSFTELTTFLNKLIETETDYIQLDIFPDHSYYNTTLVDNESNQDTTQHERV